MQKKTPSAITKIVLDRATFSKVPVDELTFINFFYGNNGVGKSSIARAIAENDGVEWTAGKTRADYDVLVYNQDFINNNFANYGDLAGVFIFGEENIEAKRKIAELTERKKDIDSKCTTAGEKYRSTLACIDNTVVGFQNTCFSKTADLRKRFEKCLRGKKTKKVFAAAILGESCPTEMDVSRLERLYEVAFDDTARTYPEFRHVGFETSFGSLPGKKLLGKVIVSSGDAPFANFMKALGISASSWVRDGHTHYSAAAGGKCPYCQQPLPQTFEADIAACFDEQYQQDIRALARFKAAYESETARVVRELKANMADVLETVDLKPYQEKIALLESGFEVNRQRIAAKCKDPAMTVSLEDTDAHLYALNGIIDDINQIIKANNDVVNEKTISQRKCKTAIMQHLAYVLADDVKTFNDETERLAKESFDLLELGKQLKKEISDLTTQICDLNKHNVNTEAAVNGINKILHETGFQGFGIRVKANEENVYEVVRKNGSVAKNLSEGERNFIAFLYFYHLTQGSKNNEERKEKIVVIDDPVSGMDSSALFVVGSLVREMINVCRNNTEYRDLKVNGDHIKQLFILTHNVYFHREITYGQTAYYGCASFYMIGKSDNVSTVKLCARQSKDIPSEQENYNPVRDSYAALWEELCDIRSTIPALNVMRRILEYYFLQTCGYDGNDLRALVLEREESRDKFINHIEGGQPDMTDYQRAASLLSYINNAYGINDSLNYVEDSDDVEAYKNVFKRIFEVLGQKHHYDMMTNKLKS